MAFLVICLVSQNSLHFKDLRTFVAKSCRQDLRNDSTNFSELKNSPRQFFCFLDVCFGIWDGVFAT